MLLKLFLPTCHQVKLKFAVEEYGRRHERCALTALFEDGILLGTLVPGAKLPGIKFP